MADKATYGTVKTDEFTDAFGRLEPRQRSHSKRRYDSGKHFGRAPFLKQSSQPFLDPAPFKIPDEDNALVGEASEFKYLKAEKLNFIQSFYQRLHRDQSDEAFKNAWQKIYTAFLVFVAIIIDGLRPISLVWAKGGNKSYPFMFSTWIMLVKFSVVVFSVIMLYISRRKSSAKTELNSVHSKAGSDKQSLLESGASSTEDDVLTGWDKFKLSFYLLPPTMIYITSDILNFIMFKYISASTFSVVKQTRLVVVALLYRFYLHRSVSVIQWLAVANLVCSSILFEQGGPPGKSEEAKKDESTGLIILMVKIFIDSLAVIWMDKYFKRLDAKGFPYPEQQVYYALQSLIGGIAYMLVMNGHEIFVLKRGLFDGYTTGAWGSALLCAMYGILVSLLLRYLDSMIKMLQSLASVLVTIFLDWLVFGKQLTLIMVLAILLVLSSVMLYKIGTIKRKDA